MTKKKPKVRLYQDSEFVFDGFNGLQIERLIVCENIKTESPSIIYLKVENRNWHQYFLDAGIGCWENCYELDNFNSDGHFKYTDSTKKLKLHKKQISKIHCVADYVNSKIIIELEKGEQLILKCVNPEIFDSQCELIKITEQAGR